MGSDGAPAVRRWLVLPSEQWQRNEYLIVLTVFLTFLGFNFVMPFLPLYVQELGVTDVAAAAFWSGLALSVTPLLGAVLAPVWGAAADRFGRKPMFARSLLGFAILMTCMSLVSNVYQLVAIRVLWGFVGGFAALSTALVALNCPRQHMSRAVGLVQSAQIISYAVGPGVGGILADHLGLRQSFYVPTVLFVMALVLTQVVYKEIHEAPGVMKTARGGIGLREVLHLPNFLPVVAVLFVAQFVDKSFGAVLPLYVASLEPTATGVASMSGLIISLGALAAAISAGSAGRMAGQRSPRRLMLISLLGGLVVCLPMAFVGSTWQFLVLRVLLGLLAGGTITLAYTVGGLAMPAQGQATAFGFLSSAAMLGSALSPMLSGLLAGVSLRAVYIVDALLYGLALVVLLLARPMRVAEEQATGPGPAR